jgi:putative SOS response-associated peptidase YedK
MCYSAQIRADYKHFFRLFGGVLTLRAFAELYYERQGNPKVKIPKAMDAAFETPQNDEEREIKGLIDAFNADQATKLGQDIFAQRKRVADAERRLLVKTTKKATNDVRIATAKVEWGLGKLADLNRSQPEPRDARIFPGMYAPVMIWENGQRVVKPMRYHCRPAGKPENFDVLYPGTYNARRDNLEGFWRHQFGVTHGVLVINSFYEHVDFDGKDTILEFMPQPVQDMWLACLWSRWKAPGQPDLLSFAVIMDEPPDEIRAAGHDRCPIPLKPENVDAWLRPDLGDLDAQYAILDERARPYYEHRLAA